MTNIGLKKLLGFIIRNKIQIGELLNRFQAEDVEKGIISLPQDLFNRDLKMLIMEKSDPYLDDYNLLFSNGSLFVDATAIVKQLGKINAKYMFTIEELTFNRLVRKITISYQEDVRSQGNMVQSLALKAAGLKGPYLQTAIEMNHISYARISGNRITIDLDKIDFIKKVPSELELNYLSSQDGTLKLKFLIE